MALGVRAFATGFGLGLLLSAGTTRDAFAKGGHGGGHGGGHASCGHSGGSHGGGSHATAPASVVHAGSSRGGSLGPTRAGSYLPPPPLLVSTSAGMSCAGSPLALGDAADRVRSLCGSPSEVKNVVFAFQRGERIIEIWRYQRPGALDHVLRFENGSLVSLDAVGAVAPAATRS